MQTFQVITTVDITNPHVNRDCEDLLLAAQQSNFNALVQAINMRSNITWTGDPKRYSGGMPWPAEGRSVHWVWQFTTERESVFADDSSPVGLLLNDLHGVPIIPDLTNSDIFEFPIFSTKLQAVNTWVTEIA